MTQYTLTDQMLFLLSNQYCKGTDETEVDIFI